MARNRSPPSEEVNKATGNILSMRTISKRIKSEAVKAATRYKMLCEKLGMDPTKKLVTSLRKDGSDENMNSISGGFNSSLDFPQTDRKITSAPLVSKNTENATTFHCPLDTIKKPGMSAVAAALGISFNDTPSPIEQKPIRDCQSLRKVASSSILKPKVFSNCKVSRGSVNVTKGVSKPSQIMRQNSATPKSSSTVSLPTLSRREMLDMYYLACCEPAFPQTGDSENMTPQSANYYYDSYSGLQGKLVSSRL